MTIQFPPVSQVLARWQEAGLNSHTAERLWAAYHVFMSSCLSQDTLPPPFKPVIATLVRGLADVKALLCPEVELVFSIHGDLYACLRTELGADDGTT